jgi:hypothetical protein
MKSQILRFFLSLFLFLGSFSLAQPKISVGLGLGLYEPTLSGFDENIDVRFPTGTMLNRNFLLNWAVYYEFFSNARLGYNSYSSFEAGKLDLINSTAVYRRTIIYRMFPLETYFRWKPRIELNFTLTPIWGRGRIYVDTTPGDKSEDWNQLINSFGVSKPVSDLGATDAMINDWIGFSGMIGIRYYLSTRIGLDMKMGFMDNSYKNDKWRLQKKEVTGPIMKIDELPIFSFKVFYGFK